MIEFSTKAKYPMVALTKKDALNLIAELAKMVNTEIGGCVTVAMVEDETKPSAIVFYVQGE